MQLGMHFALTDALAERLRAAAGDDDALRAFIEEIEEAGVPSCETDKAWDPISCALAPASAPDRDPEEWPAYGVILGDEDLQEDSDELLVTYLSAEHVPEVAAWLDTLDEETFAAAYAVMPEELRNPEYGDDERDYAWGYLEGLHAFLTEAARSGSHVVFHVEH